MTGITSGCLLSLNCVREVKWAQKDSDSNKNKEGADGSARFSSSQFYSESSASKVMS